MGWLIWKSFHLLNLYQNFKNKFNLCITWAKILGSRKAEWSRTWLLKTHRITPKHSGSSIPAEWACWVSNEGTLGNSILSSHLMRFCCSFFFLNGTLLWKYWGCQSQIHHLTSMIKVLVQTDRQNLKRHSTSTLFQSVWQQEKL